MAKGKNFPLGHTQGTGPNTPKIISQSEWDDLNNAFQDTSYLPAEDAGFFGNEYRVPQDGLQTPHRAYVNEDDNSKVDIGRDRQEDWYPYVDSITCKTVITLMQFERVAAYNLNVPNFFLNDISIPIPIGGRVWQPILFNTYYRDVTISLEDPIKYEPGIPDDKNNGELYGYQIKTYPKKLYEKINGNFLTVVYTETVSADVAPYGATSVLKTRTDVEPISGCVDMFSIEYTGQNIDELEQVNPNYVSFANFVDTLTDDSYAQNVYLQATSAYVPIGIAWYDRDQDLINRNVQLLIGSPSIGISDSIKSGGFNTGLRHPFKGTLSGTTSAIFDQIVIGVDRAEDIYEFEDRITVNDFTNDSYRNFYYDKPDKVTIDDVDRYVYYDLYKGNDGTWYSEVSSTPVWPLEETHPGHIYKQVGFAKFNAASGGIYSWGQEMFECPTENPPYPRGAFEAEYRETEVYITSGQVFGFAFSGDVDGKSYPLSANTDIWVKLTSDEVTDEEADITIETSLENGTYDEMVEESGDRRYLYYKIGSVVDNTYEPYHTGNIYINNTLLMPTVNSDVQGSDNSSIQVLGIDNTYLTDVGYTSNDVLLDGRVTQFDVELGSWERIVDVSGVTFYGYTYTSGTTFDIVSNGISGFTLSNTDFDVEFEKGLCQDFDINDAELHTVPFPQGRYSINNVDQGDGFYELLNDEDTPGVHKYYGTDGTGTKGYHSIVSGILVSANDTTPGYLEDKIKEQTSPVTITISPEGGNEVMYFDIACDYSVQGGANITLRNDEDNPGANTFYGCDGSTGDDDKGWKDFTQITVITDVQLDSNNDLQIKTRTCYVYNPSSESSWTTVDGWTTTDCPSGV